MTKKSGQMTPFFNIKSNRSSYPFRAKADITVTPQQAS